MSSIVVVVGATATADTLVVQRLNTDDILIPVFDSSLGTLNSVSLYVVLLPGSTSSGGTHEHPTVVLESQNAVSSPGGFSSFFTSSSSVSPQSLTITTPSYSGGGIDIGSFFTSTSPVGGHGHESRVSYAGYRQVGPSSYLISALVDSQPSGPFSASYGGAAKSLVFSGYDLEPFLAQSDIAISAGQISTSPLNPHNHGVAFSTYVGPTPVFFSGTLPTSSGGGLLLDPVFSTYTTFEYTPHAAPVPEPGLLTLTLTGIASVIGMKRLRRDRFRSQRAA